MHLTDFVFLNKIGDIEISPTTLNQIHMTVGLLKDPETGVEIKDRVWHCKTYKQCFIARDLVTWISTFFNTERHVSLRIGLYLQERGFIEHVAKDHILKDEFLFFVFLSTQQRRQRALSVGTPAKQKRLSVLKDRVKRLSTNSITTKDVISGFRSAYTKLSGTLSLDIPQLVFETCDKNENLDLVDELLNTRAAKSCNGSPSCSPTKFRSRVTSKKYSKTDSISVTPTSWTESGEVLDVETDGDLLSNQEIDRVRGYEIKIKEVAVYKLEPLPTVFRGGKEGHEILTSGNSLPYLKIIVEDEVHTTENKESLDPRWWMDATFTVNSLPVTCVVAVLDHDKSHTDGEDLFGYVKVDIDIEGKMTFTEKMETVESTDATIPSQITFEVECCVLED